MSEEIDTQEAAQAVSTGPPLVRLGALTVQLVDPPSLLALSLGRTKEEVDAGGLAVTLALGAAALRGCWPESVSWPVKPRPRPWAIGQRPAVYGSEVWEALRAGTKGRVPFPELQAACIAAHNYAVGSALTEQEVATIADFSAGQGEG